MAVKQTLQIGDTRLKAENKSVSDFNDPAVGQVIQDLVDTMHQNGLIGMAAQQIGENVIYEGCGSVLNGTLFGPVKRPKEITIEAFDQNGRKFRLTCDGF